MYHRVQHIKKIYVDLKTYSNPPKTWWEHMHYVALSRVTNYAGIYINDLNESQICVSKKVSHYLLDANKITNYKLIYNYFKKTN